MMKSLHRYRALAAADRWHIVEAAMLLAAIRLGLPAVQFPLLRRSLDRWVRLVRCAPAGAPMTPASRLVWAVEAAARHLPIRTTCLIESLAVDAMLRRRGYASQIRFGVRPPQSGALAGHAWVEHDGRVVFGAHELTEYSMLWAQNTE